MRSDDEIRKQQRKLEGVAAPLGDSSENSQLLQKLLYESYQGRRTVPYQVPGINYSFVMSFAKQYLVSASKTTKTGTSDS